MQLSFTCFYLLILGLGICAIAVLVARLRIEQIRAGVRQQMSARTYERRRIARDLHDTLLPGVQSLLLRINIWADDPALPGELRAEIKAVWQRARDIVVESRDRICLLRNGDNIKTDLFATLNSIAKARAGNEVPVLKVALKGYPQRLTNDAYHELADIAQEAIRNALQHANAQRIQVTVEFTARCIVLVIADDGCGLPTHLTRNTCAPAHYGILGMRERARYLDATFSLGPNDTCGTKVTIGVRADIAFSERQGSGWSRVVTYLHRALAAIRST
jgi:signal transduction histidine kinase